ncbi:unnamed protein product [Penicillium salamii]|uniref:Uncharacterized protein n=1 Tax=Penicillium salamii TaxID=1612424 RepID=A0A9W4NEF9_9EURO|nr:unnamed protein product [Penicillium salamii]CAG8164612.1 unnamed protein product [Penicillium salamii]CAG8359004.1 unnamed protein product [Penicillium salamii]CAG8365330.1 unnamed protein product [Penicillium salamii]CAG8367602.1 unnamed protein product [Penicillium salamii]
MRSPEMSHSPAYYQEQGPFGTANPRSIPTPPPAARRSQEQSSILGHPVGSRPSSLSSDASPRASASRGYRVYHQTQGGSSWPTAESRDTDSFPAGSTLSGAHKEERVRSSITDRPSLMSGEHSNPSITRVRKRGIPSDEIVTHEGHDALLMLFRLTIVPVYSFGACFYAIFAFFFALLVSPLRLCSFSQYLRSTTFVSQLCDLLSPSLHIHERLVCIRPPSVEDRSSSTQWIRSDPESDQPSVLSEPSEVYSIAKSMAVLVLSPIFSIAILLLAWIAAFFWVFSMMLGNPDGTERKDDGRTAVLGVCKWWRTWLCKARKS